jgi:hypothetical protein
VKSIVFREFLRVFSNLFLTRFKRSGLYASFAGKTCQVTVEGDSELYCGPSEKHSFLSTMRIACRFANPERARRVEDGVVCECTKRPASVHPARRGRVITLLVLLGVLSVIGSYVVLNRAALKSAVSEIARRFSEGRGQGSEASLPVLSITASPDGQAGASTAAATAAPSRAAAAPPGVTPSTSPSPVPSPPPDPAVEKARPLQPNDVRGDFLFASNLYRNGLKAFNEGNYAAASRQWKDMIRSYRGKNFTIELTPRHFLDSVYGDLQRLGDGHNAFSLPGASGTDESYLIFVGLFQNKEDADRVFASLPSAVREEGAQIRRVHEIRPKIQ